jgi:hypothetical protein
MPPEIGQEPTPVENTPLPESFLDELASEISQNALPSDIVPPAPSPLIDIPNAGENQNRQESIVFTFKDNHMPKNNRKKLDESIKLVQSLIEQEEGMLDADSDLPTESGATKLKPPAAPEPDSEGSQALSLLQGILDELKTLNAKHDSDAIGAEEDEEFGDLPAEDDMGMEMDDDALADEGLDGDMGAGMGDEPKSAGPSSRKLPRR